MDSNLTELRCIKGPPGGHWLPDSASWTESAKAAKAVFKALDGVALGAQKKDAGIARQYFDKYAAAMPVLLKAVS